jgi:prepilin-type processing-associated H-X9-DG protein
MGFISGGERTWPVKTIAFPPNSPYFHGFHVPTSPRYVGTPILDVIARAALKSNHSGGIHVLFLDGGVHFLKNTIDLTVYKNLADRADGSVVGDF